MLRGVAVRAVAAARATAARALDAGRAAAAGSGRRARAAAAGRTGARAAGAARTAAGGAVAAVRAAGARWAGSVRAAGNRSGPWTEAAGTWRLVAAAAALGAVAVAAAVPAAGPWQGGQRRAERAWAARHDGIGRTPPGAARRPPLAPAVLAGIGPGATGETRTALAGVPTPTPRGLDDVLAPLFADPALGSLHTGAVLDAATGRQLFARKADTPSLPASTTKIATSVAVLETRGADYRIPTVVVPGARPGTIVLVGGGDPTLTAAPASPHADPDATPASLAALADATARSLRERGEKKVGLEYDTSLYTGPRIHPIGVNDNIAPVTALMADEGRIDPHSTENAPRYADPAGSAAHAFADLLRSRGVSVAAVRPGRAPQGREAQIAEVDSMPVSALVERMLTHSDNDIAEALARQVALGTGHPVSFAGAGAAIRSVLARLHLPLAGTSFNDGSGLDHADRLTAALLTRLLVTAASPAHPELRPVLSGLPVAGFTGTLSDRFRSSEDDHARAGGDPAGAAGLVRAKTGTLTGVNTLAGIVVDADGRMLVFAFLASGTGGPYAAEAALDRLAEAVTNCGCR